MIAGGLCLSLAAAGYGLARFYPALGPIAGTITPQLYIDSLPNVRIPVHGRSVLVDAASARLYMIEDGHVRVASRPDELGRRVSRREGPMGLEPDCDLRRQSPSELAEPQRDSFRGL